MKEPYQCQKQQRDATTAQRQDGRNRDETKNVASLYLTAPQIVSLSLPPLSVVDIISQAPSLLVPNLALSICLTQIHYQPPNQHPEPRSFGHTWHGRMNSEWWTTDRRRLWVCTRPRPWSCHNRSHPGRQVFVFTNPESKTACACVPKLCWWVWYLLQQLTLL